ncbi:MAG: ABC transporter substrate-binding protein [Bacillota bacterium]|nr:ABC transporter substrate-binding protein [Bacillota bacterium]
MITGEAFFPHPKQVTRGLALLVCLSLVLGGCAPARPAEREGGTLTIGVPGLPALDPHRSAAPHPLFRLVYDTLVSRQPDLTYGAGLASEWRVSPDGREVTLRLRPGVLFHDGTRLDGPAVAASIERVMGGSPQEFPVRALLGPLREVRASDDDVTLAYDHPFPPVWEALADIRLAIVSPASLAAQDPAAAGSDQAGPQLAEAGVAGLSGSGPFVPVERDGAQLRLRRFAAYRWPPAQTSNPGPAYPDEVRLLGLGDPANGGEPAQMSGVDMLWWPAGDAPPGDILRETAGWRSYPFAGTRLIYLSCVLLDPVFADPVVRQALRLLIDRDALLPLPAFPARGTVGLLPESTGGRVAETTGPNPGAAAEMLSAAGWTEGPDGVRHKGDVRLEARLATYTGEPGYEAVAAALLTAMSAAGFDCRLTPPRRDAKPGLVAAAPNLWLLYHDWPDPDVLYYVFHTSQTGSANRTGYSNPTVDWYLDVARTEMDPDERLGFYRQAQTAIIGDGAAFGLLEARGELRVSGRVIGLRPHPAGDVLLHDIYLRDQAAAR